MASRQTLSSPLGPGFPAGVSFAEIETAAFAALSSAGMRGMMLPTHQAAGALVESTADVWRLWDAVAARIAYSADLLASNPTPTGTDSAPGLTWVGVGTPRGIRALAHATEQVDGWDGAANPDFWLLIRATIGTNTGSTQLMAGVDTAVGGFGEAIFIASTGEPGGRLGDSNAVPFAALPGGFDRTDPGTFAIRYEALTDTARMYTPGVTNPLSRVVQTSYPGAQFLGGSLFAGGNSNNLGSSIFNGTGSALHCVIAGNGVFSDTQWTAVNAWLAAKWPA